MPDSSRHSLIAPSTVSSPSSQTPPAQVHRGLDPSLTCRTSMTWFVAATGMTELAGYDRNSSVRCASRSVGLRTSSSLSVLISSSSCASTVAFATLPATRAGATCPLRECRLKGVYHITGRGPGHRISDALPSNPSRCSTGIVCLRVRKSVGASHADSRAHVRSWSVCPLRAESSVFMLWCMWSVLASCTLLRSPMPMCAVQE